MDPRPHTYSHPATPTEFFTGVHLSLTLDLLFTGVPTKESVPPTAAVLRPFESIFAHAPPYDFYPVFYRVGEASIRFLFVRLIVDRYTAQPTAEDGGRMNHYSPC